MTGYVNIAGTWRQVKAVYSNVGGTWRTVSNGYSNVGGTWRKFFAAALSVATSPSNVTTNSSRGGTLTSGSATASASGGSGSYTYGWAMASGSDSRISILSPSAATTAFRAALGSGDEADGTAICTATDTSSGVAGQATVSVQFITGGGGTQ